MPLLPPQPASAPVDPHTIHPTAGWELYLLRLRAETFRVELELERQLRSQGIATLPLEWTTYLELQREMIFDQIQSFTSLNDPRPAHTPPVSVQAVRVHPFVHPETEGSPSHASSTTFGDDGAPSQEARTHIRQSPPIPMGAPPVDHENTRRDNPPRIASTDPRQAERAHYQPHAEMFSSAQNTTISGGVFYIIQGNVSSMPDEVIAPG